MADETDQKRQSKYDEARPNLPAETRRTIEVESGHQCAIMRCGEHTYLEIHHINGNREDNRVQNLILLCDKHHKMAHAGVIDRKALQQYKTQLNRAFYDALASRVEHLERLLNLNKGDEAKAHVKQESEQEIAHSQARLAELAVKLQSSPVDFTTWNRDLWERKIKELFPQGAPQTSTWTLVNEMVRVLGHFCHSNLNHTMYPGGGGMDILGIGQSREADCLELRVSRRSAEILRPNKLYFEHIAESPWNSFFLLETAAMAPAGVYEQNHYDREELCELPNGQYLNRAYWDEGIAGYDEDGYEIPLPKESRVVTRYFSGKFLFVAKNSLWNLTSSTYDGRHNKMSAADVRKSIVAALK